jgi:hypothetical protein
MLQPKYNETETARMKRNDSGLNVAAGEEVIIIKAFVNEETSKHNAYVSYQVENARGTNWEELEENLIS